MLSRLCAGCGRGVVTSGPRLAIQAGERGLRHAKPGGLAVKVRRGSGHGGELCPPVLKDWKRPERLARLEFCTPVGPGKKRRPVSGEGAVKPHKGEGEPWDNCGGDAKVTANAGGSAGALLRAGRAAAETRPLGGHLM
ncbi:hypothetical protein NDU88_007796 [Pleurodeles waltl]|uniref:Uncharacterized protein n=1 Tax=Pleurodeles waltl TaxID=8319 RepID=A0AAV7QN34_PLEWA|nr:hypothetical protein NDU88_007796 [Pleurodeles waltl]